MKKDGFHASTSGSKKVLAVSLILALVLASISIIGALAAPGTKSKSAFGNQLRELNFDRAWFNSARLNAANFVRTSDPVKAQQYLSQYAFALQQADAIVAGRGAATTNNQSNNNNNNQSNSRTPAQQDLAGWLHTMRGLQDKLTSLGFTASVGTSNVAGAGVPVTGGSSSSSSSSSAPTSTPSSSSSSSGSAATPTPTTSSSSSSSSSATSTPTATPTTSSSSSSSSSGSSATATPSNSSSSSSSTGNSTSSSGAIPNTGSQTFSVSPSVAKAFGPQLRELDSDRAFFNSFRADPKNFTSSNNLAQIQQWLSQYAVALREADAIIAGRGIASTSNNQNQTSTQLEKNRSAQQDLAGWLHMMRGLREKLTGTNNVNSTSGNLVNGM